MESALRNCTELSDDNKVCAVTKEILTLRPHIAVIDSMLKMLVAAESTNLLELLCNNTDKGNLKYDFTEGVAVYNEGILLNLYISYMTTRWARQTLNGEH